MFQKLQTKILTVILVTSLMLTAFIMPVASANESVYDYSEAVAALQSFGILSEGVDPSKAVTRGEFVSVVTKLFGIAESGLYPAASAFNDVLPEDEYYTAVNVTTDLGLVSGFGDGTFRPAVTITKPQAVKILVTLTGYEPLAGTYGGYPSGYLTVASTLDMLKGVTVSDTECTLGEAAMLIYNAIRVDLMKNAKYPVAEYTVIEGDTILKTWLHIYETEGIVEANDLTSIYGNTPVPDGCVKIEGNTYVEGKTDVSLLLGYKVKAYYKENDTLRNELIFAVENSNCKLKTFSSKDVNIHTFDLITNFNASLGKYEENVITSASVIYNNKYLAKTGGEEVKLKPAEGNIKLLDNNCDGTIDVVFVEEYTVMFIDSINAVTYTIADKYSNARLVLDPEDKDLEYSIIKEGKSITFEDLLVNDVVSVLKTPGTDGKTFIRIIVGTERFAGQVTEIGEETIYIDGEEFEIFDSVKTQIAKLSLTDRSLFYLTYDGKIGGLGGVVSGGQEYGYITAGGCVKKGGIGADKIATIRMFSISKKELVNYDTADRLSINGSRVDEEGIPYDGRKLVDMLNDGGKFKHQLVKFRLDDNEKITDIEFSKNYVEYSYFEDGTGPVDRNTNSPLVNYAAIEEDYKGYDLDNFSRDYMYVSRRFLHTNSEYYCHFKDFNGGLFDNRYLSANATIIEVPTEYDGDLIDEKYIQVPLVFQDDTSLRFFEVYDSDEKLNASVIIVRPVGGGSTVQADFPHFILDKVTSTTLEDGLNTKKIYGYFDGVYKNYPISENYLLEKGEAFFNNLKRGDVFRIGIDPAGHVGKIVKMFTLGSNEGSAYLMDINGYNLLNQNDVAQSYFRINMESVTGHIRVSSTNGTMLNAKFYHTNATIPVYEKATVVVYDEKSDTLKTGTLSDIYPDDEKQSIVFRAVYGQILQVYVINRETAYYPVWAGSTLNYN